MATIPTPSWAWTLLPKSLWKRRLHPWYLVCSKWPHIHLGALLTFLWDHTPFHGWELNEFLGARGQGVLPRIFYLSYFPSWIVPSLWFVYIRYSVLVQWNGFVPTCLLLSSSLWLCRSPGSEGFPPANPKALLYLTVTPFCSKK